MKTRSLGAVIYDADIKILKSEKEVTGKCPSPRGTIEAFSEASRRRLLEVARNSGWKIQSQICLSYPAIFPHDGQAVKAHLNAFLVGMKRYYGSVSYLWCLEFQKRGAPHLHVFLSIEANDANRAKLSDLWARLITKTPEDYNDVVQVHKHPRNFIIWNMSSGQYLVKQYLAKTQQKDVPEQFNNVGRWWGHSRDMSPAVTAVCFDDLDEKQESALQKIIRIVTKKSHRDKEGRIKHYEQTTGRKVRFKAKDPRKRSLNYRMPLAANLFLTLLTAAGITIKMIS